MEYKQGIPKMNTHNIVDWIEFALAAYKIWEKVRG
jgi:hypothetical protein